MLRGAVLLILAGLLLLPLVLRQRDDAVGRAPAGARPLIIFTPHNEQIREEFAEAFEAWHQRRFGQPVRVIWSVPGGTSEIRRMLQSQTRAALRAGRPIGGNADLLFGGGSFEFAELAKPIDVEVSAEKRSGRVLAPIEFDAAFLGEVYGPENRIGDDLLFDPQLHWFGTALSGFGIVYNRDLLKRLGVSPPTRWADLADPRLLGAVALVNPSQSGSITTAFEAILLRRGWDEGWRTLRRAGANARSFSASSAKVPLDVAAGAAAAGICIDFYGRFESQAIAEAGGGDRIGYVDPVGETRLDADPIALLMGAPDPELARRFVEFVLSEEGQALWQFPVRQADVTAGGSSSPDLSEGVNSNGGRDPAPLASLGPRRHELRRMPIRRALYADEAFFDRFVDRVDPWTIASEVEAPDRNVRAFIVPLFLGMAIEEHDLLRRAWRAIVEHPAYPRDRAGAEAGLVTAADVADPTLRRMLEHFDAMPEVRRPDGGRIELAAGPDLAARLAEVRAGWLREGWKDQGLWSPETAPAEELRREFRRFFEAQYRAVLALAAGSS